MAGLPAGNIHILSKSRTSFNHCFVTQDPLWPKLPSYTDSVLGKKKKKNRKESIEWPRAIYLALHCDFWYLDDQHACLQTVSFVGWTYLPYAASPDLWKKKKLPWPSRQDALLQWLNQFWLLSFFSYHSQSWLQFLGYNVKSVRLERLAIK